MSNAKTSEKSLFVASVLVTAILCSGSLVLGQAPGTAEDTAAIELWLLKTGPRKKEGS